MDKHLVCLYSGVLESRMMENQPAKIVETYMAKTGITGCLRRIRFQETLNPTPHVWGIPRIVN